MTHRPVSVLAAVVFVILVPPCEAQPGLLRDENVRYPFDSGWVANGGDALDVVISFPVHVETARHLRLYFDDVVLSGSVEDGTASILRITSLLDGEMQLLDAVRSSGATPPPT